MKTKIIVSTMLTMLIVYSSNLNASIITYTGFGTLLGDSSPVAITLKISDQYTDVNGNKLERSPEGYYSQTGCFLITEWSISNETIGYYYGDHAGSALWTLPNPDFGCVDFMELYNDTSGYWESKAWNLLDEDGSGWMNLDQLAPVILLQSCWYNTPPDYVGYQFSNACLNASPAPVPEPATMLLLGSGLLCFVGFRKKLKR